MVLVQLGKILFALLGVRIELVNAFEDLEVVLRERFVP